MPAPPPFGDLDFQQAMQRLTPKGRAWRSDIEATLSATLLALAPAYTRSSASAAQVLIDASPATTENLLAEWEESLGLPDPCTPLNPSFAQRQAAVRAKFGARGALSVPYFISLAATLGYAITITEFAPFRPGVSHFGDLLCGPGWQFVWQVNAPQITVNYFRFGASAFGDAFWTISNTELACRLRANAPAHTVLIFRYSAAPFQIGTGAIGINGIG